MSDWIRALAVSFARRLVQEEQAMDFTEQGSMARFDEWWNDGMENAQALIVRECAVWNELQAIPSYRERFVSPLVIINEQGEEMHTAERPFCADMRCTCHNDSDLWHSYIYQPWLDGLMTINAAAALFSGK